ncbi:hypothetical protein SDY_4583 [Shigella dysenteriae Sd197]|uniref:Uncharacterized protein n=1 Tax=Shigella dysenteriae serotype 1 (strain Sd197) TaxID=300267 RepID=Q327R1_SHIDS|nr:hypothetical protein SDY_4583 [Shigella dysenteriae Sd197]
MTSLKTSIKTITYLSDTGCLEIQGASLIHQIPDTSLQWEIVVAIGDDSNLLMVFYVQIMPDDFVMQLHRF